MTYSEQFDNAAWSAAGVTLIANSSTAPNGTVTADTLTATSSGYNSTYRTETVVSGSSYTLSIYAKANVTSLLSLEFRGSGSSPDAIFNLANGTVSSGTGVISSAGNGWYRCSITKAAVDASEIVIVGLNGVNSNIGDSIYIWGAQLEVGSTATAYMVSGASNGFRAVPVVSGSATAKGLLVEEQRQNLLPASNDFSNVTYWTGGGSVTANATTSPDGTVNAAIGASINPASGVGDATVAISGSIFAKANPSGASSLVVRINRFGSGTDYLQVTFNLSTGVAGAVTNSGTASGGSASMTAFGNGWYRCVLSGTASTTAGTLSFNPQSTCFIYGAQLEAGSFATSLIPTLASAVTRSADVASVNTLSPWINQTEGSLLVDFSYAGLGSSQAQCAAAISGSTASDYSYVGKNTAGNNIFEVNSGGSASATLGFGSALANTNYRLAGTYKVNDFAGSLNGGAVQTDTSGAVQTSFVALNIGYLISGVPLYLNGHLRRIAYYPRRLTNAELQALTA